MMSAHRMVSAAPTTKAVETIELKGGGQNLIVDDYWLQKAVLYRYYPDITSLTGWSQQEIPLPGETLAAYTVGYEADGKPRLFATTVDRRISRNAHGI